MGGTGLHDLYGTRSCCTEPVPPPQFRPDAVALQTGESAWESLPAGLVKTGEPEANGSRDRFCAIAMAYSEYKKGPSHSSP